MAIKINYIFEGRKIMRVFRIILTIMCIYIVGYTSITISNHGWNLFPIFFGDMAEMAWPGQFNLDFMSFLILSGLWVAWRNNYSATGLALSVVAFLGGIMFLAPYLLYLSFQSNGNMKEFFMGRGRNVNKM